MNGPLVHYNGWRSTPWWADKSLAYLNHTAIYYTDTETHTKKGRVGKRRRCWTKEELKEAEEWKGSKRKEGGGGGDHDGGYRLNMAEESGGGRKQEVGDEE